MVFWPPLRHLTTEAFPVNGCGGTNAEVVNTILLTEMLPAEDVDEERVDAWTDVYFFQPSVLEETDVESTPVLTLPLFVCST